MQHEKKTVFLVDDDAVTLKIQQGMLEKQYNVVPFDDAQSALAAFPRLKPDLVISDLMMPGMDGTGLRRALVGLKAGSETPFIFLSSVAEKRDAPYINALGIDDFLCKPVTQERLLAVTERLLKRSVQVRRAVQDRVDEEITNLLSPALPAAWNGWDIAVHTRAAEAGGGDFILHHEAPGTLGWVLADVMGHGYMAKFFSYAYAGYLRSLFHIHGSDSGGPAAFLSRLSDGVRGDPFLESMVMTCQSVRLSPSGEIAVASAGHPLPVLIQADGTEDVHIAGPLPGMVGESNYREKTARLAPGEKILFATDGFLDAFDREGFAHEDLYPLLGNGVKTSAAELAAQLWRHFTAYSADIADDATLVVAGYGGKQ